MTNESLTIEQMLIDLKTRFDRITELLMAKLDAGLEDIKSSPVPSIDLSDPLDEPEEKPTYSELLAAYIGEIELNQAANQYIIAISDEDHSDDAAEKAEACLSEYQVIRRHVAVTHPVPRAYAFFTKNKN